jgi:hypothetical protein
LNETVTAGEHTVARGPDHHGPGPDLRAQRNDPERHGIADTPANRDLDAAFKALAAQIERWSFSGRFVVAGTACYGSSFYIERKYMSGCRSPMTRSSTRPGPPADRDIMFLTCDTAGP